MAIDHDQGGVVSPLGFWGALCLLSITWRTRPIIWLNDFLFVRVNWLDEHHRSVAADRPAFSGFVPLTRVVRHRIAIQLTMLYQDESGLLDIVCLWYNSLDGRLLLLSPGLRCLISKNFMSPHQSPMNVHCHVHVNALDGSRPVTC